MVLLVAHIITVISRPTFIT